METAFPALLLVSASILLFFVTAFMVIVFPVRNGVKNAGRYLLPLRKARRTPTGSDAAPTIIVLVVQPGTEIIETQFEWLFPPDGTDRLRRW